MKRALILITAVFIAGCAAVAPEDAMQADVDQATAIIERFEAIPEAAIPPAVMRAARGLAILNVTKAGFIGSVRGGTGVVVQRTENGWSGPSAMCHGHGSKTDEADIDAERFFRAVDRAVLEHHSKPSGLPLLLAALPHYHSLFRQVSHNPFLAEEAVDVHPDALTSDELRERASRVFEPRYLARLAAVVEEFGRAKSKGLGSDELANTALAAVAGRIGKLMIEAERHIPGRIDYTSGSIASGDLAHPEVDDLLDDLAELVLKKGGQVLVVPAERISTRTGIAAVYRF